MTQRHGVALLVRETPPPLWVGALVAVLAVALCTALLYPLKTVAPVVSLGVVYLLAVMMVSANWGLVLGVPTSLASAAAFNWFHIPPVGRFTVGDPQNWVALAAFVVAAIMASAIAQAFRDRAADALERRREADLAAEMARVLLRGEDIGRALDEAAAHLARALGIPWAIIEFDVVAGDERRVAFALREDDQRIGTLLLPPDLDDAQLGRIGDRVVPALEALLAAALERERLHREVVETDALRRSDELKTALLRTVSHDLRTPLTAIVSAGETVDSERLTAAERHDLAEVIVDEGTRLSRLVDKLLDLSKLQAGAAEPRREWSSVEEVLEAAAGHVSSDPTAFALFVDQDLPLVRADAAQLERAFANLFENGLRHAGGAPVSVHARFAAGRIVVRIVDRGPGIPPDRLERIFEPFYRGNGSVPSRGSGLGLAIARGLLSANGGTVRAESLPGQGACFVVEIPA